MQKNKGFRKAFDCIIGLIRSTFNLVVIFLVIFMFLGVIGVTFLKGNTVFI